MPPDYLRFGGATLPPPPYSCRGVAFHAFGFRAEPGALQSFVDRSLNAVAGRGAFKALLDFAFFAAVDIAAVGSADAPELGSMAEIDLGWWMLVGRNDQAPASVPALAWYPAYTFVDNWLATAGGREVWGYPKALATLEAPGAAPGAGPFSATTLAFRAFGRDQRAAPAELFRITRTGGPPNLNADFIEALADQAAIARTILGRSRIDLTVRTALQTLFDAVERVTPMVFLKQLRDSATAGAACYREVIAADARLLTLRRFGFLTGMFELELNDFASHPIAADLGLTAGRQSCAGGVWADFDFDMELGAPLPR